MSKVIKGKPIMEGIVEGEALVSTKRINLLYDLEFETGNILRKDHEYYGVSVAGKILVFPSGVGSVGLSSVLYNLVKNGVAPKAIINQELETTIVFGALISKVPMVSDLEVDILKAFKTGDILRVDGGKGEVTILKKA